MRDTLVMVKFRVSISMNALLVTTIVPLLVEDARILLVTMNATDVLTVTLVTVYFAMTLMNASPVA